LGPEDYLRVLSNAACAIGNSSSFVRDASFFGTPVVLAGRRQVGRETDEHVTAVAPLTSEIVTAVQAQLARGRYGPSTLYGDGHVSERIADALASLTPYIQKRLHYVHDGGNGKQVNDLNSSGAAIFQFVELPQNVRLNLSE
jgi:UDP-N-acetylglucosamine 2-epimerase